MKRVILFFALFVVFTFSAFGQNLLSFWKSNDETKIFWDQYGPGGRSAYGYLFFYDNNEVKIIEFSYYNAVCLEGKAQYKENIITSNFRDREKMTFNINNNTLTLSYGNEKCQFSKQKIINGKYTRGNQTMNIYNNIGSFSELYMSKAGSICKFIITDNSILFIIPNNISYDFFGFTYDRQMFGGNDYPRGYSYSVDDENNIIIYYQVNHFVLDYEDGRLVNVLKNYTEERKYIKIQDYGGIERVYPDTQASTNNAESFAQISLKDINSLTDENPLKIWGWSRDGKVGISELGSGMRSYTVKVFVFDTVSDKVVWERTFDSYDYDNNTPENVIIAFFNNFLNVCRQQFEIEIQEKQLLIPSKSAIIHNGKTYNIAINAVKEDEYKIRSYSVVVETNGKRKTILSSGSSLPNSPYFNRYIISPFEERALIILRWDFISHSFGFVYSGCHLSIGFK